MNSAASVTQFSHKCILDSDSGSSVYTHTQFPLATFKLWKWYSVHVYIFTSALLTAATNPEKIYFPGILFDRRIDWLVFRSLYCTFEVLPCENQTKLPMYQLISEMYNFESAFLVPRNPLVCYVKASLHPFVAISIAKGNLHRVRLF